MTDRPARESTVLTDESLRALRLRLYAAGDPEAGRAVQALELALRVLDGIAYDETMCPASRRVAGGAWAIIRHGDGPPDVPTTPE